MIDEKGRLFGKINIIDLIVIAVLVIAIAAVGVSVFLNNAALEKDANANREVTLEMKYYIEEVNDFVAEKVHVGDRLWDDAANHSLGEVTNVEIGEPASWASTADGRYVPAAREGFSSMIITGEVEGKKTEIGAEINKLKYGVGHTMVLRAGDAKLYLRVYDITVKEK